MGAVISVPRFSGAQHRGERHAALDQGAIMHHGVKGIGIKRDR